MFFQCYALLSSPCSRHFPGTLPSGPCVGFILLGYARVSVHHKTTEELSRLSPEKWVSTIERQTSFLIFFPSGAKSVPGTSTNAWWLSRPKEIEQTQGTLSPSTKRHGARPLLPLQLLCPGAGAAQSRDCPFIALDDRSPSRGPSSCNNKKYTIGVDLQSINAAPLLLQSQSTTCPGASCRVPTRQPGGERLGIGTAARSSAKQNLF